MLLELSKNLVGFLLLLILYFMEWISIDGSPTDQPLLSCSHSKKLNKGMTSPGACVRPPLYLSATSTRVMCFIIIKSK